MGDGLCLFLKEFYTNLMEFYIKSKEFYTNLEEFYTKSKEFYKISSYSTKSKNNSTNSGLFSHKQKAAGHVPQPFCIIRFMAR
jgi:hypothetical protein